MSAQVSLFTSIPSQLNTRQLAQLKDTSKLWSLSGASLTSLNFSEEANAHPLLANDVGIDVVDCGPRSHAKYNNRPLVPIDVVIEHIKSRPTDDKIVGIVNSDIRPNLIYEWKNIYNLVCPREVHVFKRLEENDSCIEWEFDPFSPYNYGYDLFLTDKSTLPGLVENPDLYCFGVPWWDYWFPLMLKAEHGFRIISHDRPLITHSTHEERFSQHDWYDKSKSLRQYILLNGSSLLHPKTLSVPVDEVEFCDYCVQLIDSQSYLDSLHKASQSYLKEGISIVTACMNRNSNLVKCLPSWLQGSYVNEVIIVDWSSKSLVKDDLVANNIIDSRIKILRVEGQSIWILSKAFNYGLSRVSYSHTLKLDADIILNEGFFDNHFLDGNTFYAGNWKTANSDREKRINGSFMAPTRCLAALGFYNEYITTYGWDDCDLYERMQNLLRRQDFDCQYIAHVEQDDQTRLESQSNRLGLNPIAFPSWLSQEIEIRTNQIISRLAPRPHLDFGVSSSWLTFARLIGYRYSLALKLSKPWKDGGINLPLELLLMLDDFTLASILSYRCIDFASISSGVEGAYFLESFLRFHPVNTRDFSLLDPYCKSLDSNRHPILNDANSFSFPTLLITRQSLEFGKKEILRANCVGRMRKVLSGSSAFRLQNNDRLSGKTSRLTLKSSQKKVTCVTVCVKSHEYYNGFLEDLNQILSHPNNNAYFIFVATSSSVAKDIECFYQLLFERDSSADLIVLTWDPGLYDCWNMVCKETVSTYVGNWNCDDRRSIDHIESLCNYLDLNPDIMGASSALYVARQAPASFCEESKNSLEEWFSGESFTYDYKDMYQRETWVPSSNRLVSQNYMHCMPVWRKLIHQLDEYFDESKFGPSADWELWMRISKKYNKRFYLHGSPMGVYFLNSSSYGRSSSADKLEENIHLLYMADSRASKNLH